jgi:hypothetical protein
MRSSDESDSSRRWVEGLNDEDFAFLKRFVLASGSLKDTAALYGISYPTVRLRLDRLIAKIKIWDSQESLSAFERTLRGEYADGTIDLSTMRRLLAAYRQDQRRSS